MMNTKEYADILKFAIKLQIGYVEQEMERPFADEKFCDGVIHGLRIALEKIDASAFLTE